MQPQIIFKVTKILSISLFVIVFLNEAFSAPTKAKDPPGGALAGDRMRVIIGTDAGRGDHDDEQSLVHFLLYADLFDIEGFIATTGNGGTGKTSAILEVIDAYSGDYDKLKTYSSNYPSPAYLKSVVVMGESVKAPSAGYKKPTAGSELIIKAAKKNDPRPLYICFWGGVTDLAQAVHDDPSIKSKIRGLAIGSVRQDRNAGKYLINNHKDLWLVRMEDSNKGMWYGGYQSGNYSNGNFAEIHIKGHGVLGSYYWNIKKEDGTYPRRIREGDTSSFLYLLRGDPNHPTKEHWGGRFQKSATKQWVDRQELQYSKKSADGKTWYGLETVSKWRVNFLDEYEKRMDRAKQKNPNSTKDPR